MFPYLGSFDKGTAVDGMALWWWYPTKYLSLRIFNLWLCLLFDLMLQLTKLNFIDHSKIQFVSYHLLLICMINEIELLYQHCELKSQIFVYDYLLWAELARSFYIVTLLLARGFPGLSFILLAWQANASNFWALFWINHQWY